MGYFETAYWQSEEWGGSRRRRRSGVYHPYVPDPIASTVLVLDTATLDAVAQAHEAMGALGAEAMLRTESVSRMLLRSEAMSSSRIEGLETPVAKLLIAEELRNMGKPGNPDSVAAMVLGNIDMMEKAIHLGGSNEALRVETLREMHRTLMLGTAMEQFGGEVRDVQNWIGGNAFSPIGAAYVPPPPEQVPRLLEDLVAFCNESKYPAIVTAAVARAQFETIHPFVDGNGRLGRALVHTLVGNAGLVPPVSLILAADKEAYLAHLRSYQSAAQEDIQVAVNSWIRYFAEATCTACSRASALSNELLAVEEKWRSAVRFRSGSAGDKLLSTLPSHPVITVERASELTGAGKESCRLAVNKLVAAGVLVQNAKNRKSNIYVAQDAVDVLSAFERAAATYAGDTSAKRPKRPVPQRRSGGAHVSLPPFEKPQ